MAERERPAAGPDVLAGSLGDADFAARSATPVDRHDVTAPGARGMLHSPTFSILAGIIAPIACFALQPLLLSGEPRTLPGLRFINVFWLFGYGIIGLEMLVLASGSYSRSPAGSLEWTGRGRASSRAALFCGRRRARPLCRSA